MNHFNLGRVVMSLFFSLRNLCVLRGSAVKFTAETQRTQRLRRESSGTQTFLNFIARLAERGLHACNLVDTVEQNEVVNHAVVSRGGYFNTGILQLARIGFALVSKRIVLRGYDERRRQTAQLIDTRL